jgi:hypothetical protein
MSPRTLIAIELSLIAGAGLIIAVILGLLGSGESAPSTAQDEAAAATVSPGAPEAFVVAGPSATPHPAARAPGDCGSPLTEDFLAANQVLSYYGNPYTADMGILGELDQEELVRDLQAHADEYDALNGEMGIRPALHIVWATAQAEEGRDGNYLLYVDERTMEEYIDLACRNGMLVFIDLQIGRSDVASEVEKALPLLEQPHVQLALDPEFAMAPGEVPGEKIGTLDAEDVNTAQQMVSELVRERGLPPKLLVVHQFLDTMITRRELLGRYPGVRLVVDMDGFGPAEIKRVKYGWYAEPADHAGIKLFFKHDPDLMTEADVLSLQPDVIIYQ